MAGLTVYCDSLSDEELVREWHLLADGALRGATVARLPAPGSAPDVLRSLLNWERADWVIADDKRVFCVVEFSRHGYTGDNSFQRFARLYRAATLGIPSIYFTPFNRSRLNELDEGRNNPRNVSPELFQTMHAMSERIGVPMVAVSWPTAPNGAPLPLGSPAVASARDNVLLLVKRFMANPKARNSDLRTDFPDVVAAMDRQAALPLRGTVVRTKVGLPIEIERSDWILKLLPPSYFSSGKADKVLAAMVLREVSDRPTAGDGNDFWKQRGEAMVLFLGYQWRPDPASGLIALAAGQALAYGLKLIVVWPRVFAERGDAQRAAVSALKQFKDNGDGPIADEARRLRLAPQRLAQFRERLSTAEHQFGHYQAGSKVGRILTDTAQALVLGDKVLTIGG
jgi:hypothetical protein